MKNIFGNPKGCEESFGDALIVRRLSPELQDRIDAESERLYREHDMKTDEQSKKQQADKFRRQLKIYKILLYVLAALTLFSYTRPGMDPSATMRENALFFWTSVLILLGAAVCLSADVFRLFSKKKGTEEPEQRTEEDGTDEDEDPVMQELARLAREELMIPEDAAEIDVLFCTYQEKRGEWKPSLLLGYFPLSVWCYADKENLYLATDCVVYALPRTTFVREQTVEEKITVAFWNKSVPYDEAPYDIYEMREVGMGGIRMKNYCSLQWRIDGEDFEVLVPTYDARRVIAHL